MSAIHQQLLINISNTYILTSLIDSDLCAYITSTFDLYQIIINNFDKFIKINKINEIMSTLILNIEKGVNEKISRINIKHLFLNINEEFNFIKITENTINNEVIKIGKILATNYETYSNLLPDIQITTNKIIKMMIDGCITSIKYLNKIKKNYQIKSNKIYNDCKIANLYLKEYMCLVSYLVNHNYDEDLLIYVKEMFIINNTHDLFNKLKN